MLSAPVATPGGKQIIGATMRIGVARMQDFFPSDFLDFLKLLWVLLTVTEVTTEHQKLKNSIKALFLPKGQKKKKTRVAGCTF